MATRTAVNLLVIDRGHRTGATADRSGMVTTTTPQLHLVALLAIVTVAAAPSAAHAPPPLVALAPDATAIESRAAHELAYFVGRLVGSAHPLQVVLPTAAYGKPQFAVGPAAAVALGVSRGDLSFSGLGAEGFLASSNRTALLRSTGSYVLSGAADAGNASTGTLYAAHHLLRWLG
eukprot:SAG31_NODE_523_length_14545_cov_4.805067_7_plen_176_part_00